MACDGYRLGYVSFAHFFLYLIIQALAQISVQEKESIMSVKYGQTNLSLGSLFGITRQSLVMPKQLPLGQICLSVPHTHARGGGATSKNL